MCDKTQFVIEFDDEEMELLLAFAADVGREPRDCIKSFVRAVLVDDACAHGNPRVMSDHHKLH